MSEGCCVTNRLFSTQTQHDAAVARLLERVNRNYDERRLTDAVFLEVAKAFDTVWVKGLLLQANRPTLPILPGEKNILLP
jgi:hypothetical protein